MVANKEITNQIPMHPRMYILVTTLTSQKTNIGRNTNISGTIESTVATAVKAYKKSRIIHNPYDWLTLVDSC